MMRKMTHFLEIMEMEIGITLEIEIEIMILVAEMKDMEMEIDMDLALIEMIDSTMVKAHHVPHIFHHNFKIVLNSTINLF